MSEFNDMERQHLLHLAERMREHLKIKYMTPSKIDMQPYQMVPVELVEEVSVILENLSER
jgi:hypothetical protein